MLSLDRQERYRQLYTDRHPEWRPSSHVYRDLVASRLFADAHVLDLGCGRGGVMERLYKRAGLTSGLDPDVRSLREHRERDLALVCGLAHALPYADDSFDLVCCSWVLEHLRRAEQTFSEIARVLRDGGRFIFLTPNAHHPLLILNRGLHWTGGRLVDLLYDRGEPDIFPAYYRANTAERIDQLARNAGMERVSLKLVGDPTYLAFNRFLFWFACRLEDVTPRRMKVHLVGEYALR